MAEFILRFFSLIFAGRCDIIHVYSVPFYAGHHYERSNRFRNRILRLRHGPQRVRLATSEYRV